MDIEKLAKEHGAINNTPKFKIGSCRSLSPILQNEQQPKQIPDGWLEVRHLGGLMPNEKELLKTTPAQSLLERKEKYEDKLMAQFTDPNL